MTMTDQHSTEMRADDGSLIQDQPDGEDLETPTTPEETPPSSVETATQEEAPQPEGYEFQNPFLKNAAPQVVDKHVTELMQGYRQALEQNQQLQAQMKMMESQSVGSPQGGVSRSGARVSADELERLREEDPLKAIEVSLMQKLEESLDPFKQDLISRKASSAWEEARKEFSDWDYLEPYVRRVVQEKGLNPSAADLIGIGHQVTGYLTRQGVYAPEGGGQTQQTQQPNGVPPQHRPSPAPLAPGVQTGAKKHRALTENEKRVAREGGMTHEEYLKFLDLDPEDLFAEKFDG